MPPGTSSLKNYLINIAANINQASFNKAQQAMASLQTNLQNTLKGIDENINSAVDGIADNMGRIVTVTIAAGAVINKQVTDMAEKMSQLGWDAEAGGADPAKLRALEKTFDRLGLSAGQATSMVRGFHTQMMGLQGGAILGAMGIDVDPNADEGERMMGVIDKIAPYLQEAKNPNVDHATQMADNTMAQILSNMAGLDFNVVRRLAEHPDLRKQYMEEVRRGDQEAGINIPEEIKTGRDLRISQKRREDSEERKGIVTMGELAPTIEKLNNSITDLNKNILQLTPALVAAVTSAQWIASPAILGGMLKSALSMLGVGVAAAAGGSIAAGGAGLVISAAAATAIGAAIAGAIILALKETGALDKMQKWGEAHPAPGFDSKGNWVWLDKLLGRHTADSTPAIDAWAKAIAKQENVNPAYNNPGGLDAVGDAGYVQSGPNKIAKFSTPEKGYDQLTQFLKDWTQRFPKMTLDDATRRYIFGPNKKELSPVEQQKLDNYEKGLHRDLGVSGDTPIGQFAQQPAPVAKSDDKTSGPTSSIRMPDFSGLFDWKDALSDVAKGQMASLNFNDFRLQERMPYRDQPDAKGAAGPVLHQDTKIYVNGGDSPRQTAQAVSMEQGRVNNDMSRNFMRRMV
jgi:hypothetical protein